MPSVVRLSVGQNVRTSDVETIELPLDEVGSWIGQHTHHIPLKNAEFLSRPKGERNSLKGAGTYVTAGVMTGTRRDKADTQWVTSITLDFDRGSITQLELQQRLHGVEAFIWHTAHSTSEAPRLRALVLLEEEVEPTVFSALAAKWLKQVGLYEHAARESLYPWQPALLPVAFEDIHLGVSHTQGALLNLNRFAIDTIKPSPTVAANDGFDWGLELDDPSELEDDEEEEEEGDSSISDLLGVSVPEASSQRELSDEQIDRQLENYKPKVPHITADLARQILLDNLDVIDPNMDYPEWIKVGFALHHQFDGSEEGLSLFIEWSQKADTRDTSLDTDHSIRGCWNAIRKQASVSGKPITFRYLMDKVGRLKVNNLVSQTSTRRWLSEIEGASTSHELELVAEAIGADEVVSESEKRRVLAPAYRDRQKKIDEVFYGKGARPLRMEDIEKLLGVHNKSVAETEPEDPRIPWHTDWGYLNNGDRFFHFSTNTAVGRRAFDAKHDRYLWDRADRKQLYKASNWALSACQREGLSPIETFHDTVYAPGRSRIVESVTEDTSGSTRMVNVWRKESHPTSTKWVDYRGLDPEWDEFVFKVAKTVLRMVGYMLPGRKYRRERRILLAWMCHIVQRPQDRIRWAMVVQGGPGVGKSTLYELIAWAVGRTNAGLLDSSLLDGQFTDWADGKLVRVIEEIRLVGERNSHTIANKLKPYITNDHVVRNAKFAPAVTVPNYTNYLMLTNHKDALPLEEADRRYCILFTEPQTKEECRAVQNTGIFSEVYQLIESEWGGSALASLAKSMDIPRMCPEFKVNGPAPDTAAKTEMMNSTAPSDKSAVIEFFADGAVGSYEASTGGDAVVMMPLLTTYLKDRLGFIPKPPRLKSVMTELGFVLWAGNARGRLRWRGYRGAAWVKGDNLIHAGHTDLIRRLDAGADSSFGENPRVFLEEINARNTSSSRSSDDEGTSDE